MIHMQAPHRDIDRVALGADRWAVLLARSEPDQAMRARLITERWAVSERRIHAGHWYRRAFGSSRINSRELDTLLAILGSWDGQPVSARVAAVIAYMELQGTRYPTAYRVLTARLTQ